jgi:hypothetical protein
MLSSGLSTTLHSEQRMDHLVELAANEEDQNGIGNTVSRREEQAFRPARSAAIPAADMTLVLRSYSREWFEFQS